MPDDTISPTIGQPWRLSQRFAAAQARRATSVSPWTPIAQPGTSLLVWSTSAINSALPVAYTSSVKSVCKTSSGPTSSSCASRFARSPDSISSCRSALGRGTCVWRSSGSSQCWCSRCTTLWFTVCPRRASSSVVTRR